MRLVQTLADEYVDLDFGHVQPTAMLGGVDELEAISQGLGLLGHKGLVQRGGTVSVEVVHHQRDALGPGPGLGEPPRESRRFFGVSHAIGADSSSCR